MFDLITIGDSTLDTFIALDESSSSCEIFKHKKLLCLNYADKTPIDCSTQSVGGNAANVAVGSRKLGLTSAIVTELGDDITGHIVKQELDAAGVDTTYVKSLKGKETRYSIVLNYDSERTIISYYAPRKYTLPRLPQSRWIYYTSLGKNFGQLQNKLVKHLKTHPSIKLAINPGSHQCKHGITKIRSLLKNTSILFVNKEEAARVLDCKPKAMKTMMRDLHKKGVKTVVITDGTKGSWASNGTEMYSMSIFPMKAFAKTGAGDAYASGFLAALSNGKDLSECMMWGSANSASVIQTFGAQKGLASKAGIKKIIKKYPKVRPTSL